MPAIPPRSSVPPSPKVEQAPDSFQDALSRPPSRSSSSSEYGDPPLGSAVSHALARQTRAPVLPKGEQITPWENISGKSSDFSTLSRGFASSAEAQKFYNLGHDWRVPSAQSDGSANDIIPQFGGLIISPEREHAHSAVLDSPQSFVERVSRRYNAEGVISSLLDGHSYRVAIA